MTLLTTLCSCGVPWLPKYGTGRHDSSAQVAHGRLPLTLFTFTSSLQLKQDRRMTKIRFIAAPIQIRSVLVTRSYRSIAVQQDWVPQENSIKNNYWCMLKNYAISGLTLTCPSWTVKYNARICFWTPIGDKINFHLYTTLATQLLVHRCSEWVCHGASNSFNDSQLFELKNLLVTKGDSSKLLAKLVKLLLQI